MIDALLLAQEEPLSLWYRSFQWLASDFGRCTMFVVLASLGIWLLLPPRGRNWQRWCGAALTMAAAATVIWLVAIPKGPGGTPAALATGEATDVGAGEATDDAASSISDGDDAGRLVLRAARLTRDSEGNPLLAIDIALPTDEDVTAQQSVLLLVALGFIEALVVLGALGTVCSRSPVYSAIWFAVTLLAIGGAMLFNGAQFLGLATVAVYAGAIVVTLLFVLMLAQPAGHTFYDRIGWGWCPALCACVAGALMVAILAMQLASANWNEKVFGNSWDTNRQLTQAIEGALRNFGGNTLSENEARVATAIRAKAGDLIAPDCGIEFRRRDTLNPAHVASFGGQLFSQHLISVEVAGVLLLVALVGAIAMASYGNEPRSRKSTQTERAMSP